MIWDKSLAWALMAGKSISGWNRLALGPWASCYVKWLFRAKAFWRETNLSGGRASNNTVFGAMKRRRLSSAAGHNSFLAACEHWGEISIAGSSTSSRATRETLLKCNHLFASASRTQMRLLAPTSLKRTCFRELKEWPAGVLAFLDALWQQNPERVPASQMRGKESQQSPK